jgi:hypothetical protein
MAALSAVPDDGSFQLLHAARVLPRGARGRLGAPACFRLDRQSPRKGFGTTGLSTTGNEYCTYALYQLAQDPVIREGLVSTPGLVPALCSDLWLLARLFIVAWTDEDDEATDEHGRGRVLPLLRRAPAGTTSAPSPSCCAPTRPQPRPPEHEGLELTPLQLARNGGFSDVALLVSRVAGEVAAGAPGKGWSLQHGPGLLRKREGRGRALPRHDAALLAAAGVAEGEGGRGGEGGQGVAAQRRAPLLALTHNAHGADPWSIVLKFAF